MGAFSYIVSLGCRCRTTRRLRDHFGFDTAFPFDWWITPLEGGIRFLDDWDLEALFDERRLREIRRWGRIAYVENTGYGIRLQHDFPTDDARERVLPGWRAHIPEARARIGYLMKKFEMLDRPHRRVLFVRELRKGEEQRPELIEGLRAAVLRRLPTVQAEFLLVSRTGVEAPGWRALKIDDPREKPWQGTPEIWDAALGSLGVVFDRGMEAGSSPSGAGGAAGDGGG